MKTIALEETKGPFPHTWEYCVGAGRAQEGLRAQWQKQLAFVNQTCGFQTVRFHGLFHEDMFVISKSEQDFTYNWQYIDSLFDAIMDCHMKPFVELGFCPEILASGDKTQFWWKANITPPKDLAQWGALISEFISHLLHRFGKEEIESWHFEVWNEPNLKGFWSGTKTEYFKLYQTSVEAIKKIDSNIPVGGPATSNFVPDQRFAGEKEDITLQATFSLANIDKAVWKPVWVEDFLLWCHQHKLPVDFISCHPYPTDFAFDENNKKKGLSRKVSATVDDLQEVDALLKKSPYPNAQRYFTEWSSSPSSRDCSHDYMPAAVYVMKTLLESANLYDCLSYWTFTDVFEEMGAGNSAFHGGFGMINFQGIVKPVWHAFRFLHNLGTTLLCNEEGLIATTTEEKKLSAIVYHYPHSFQQTVPIHYYPDFDGAQAIEETGSPLTKDILFTGLKPHATIILEYVDAQHGSAMPLYKQMGRPSSPSRKEIAALKAAARATTIKKAGADEKGRYHLSQTIKAWSFVSIREQ